MTALEDAFERAARKVGRRVVGALSEQAVAIVAAASDEPFNVNPDELMKPEWWTEVVDLHIADIVITEFLAAGEAIAAEVGVAFDLVNPAIYELADQHIDAIRSWGPDQRGWVAEKVRDGLRDGLSVRDVARSLLEAGDSPFNPVSARRTAQTELIAAQNGSAYATYVASGLPGSKAWMATPDNKTRPSHVEAGGQTVPLGEPFLVGGYVAAYPGAANLPGKERINCRCRMVFNPDDEAPAAGDVVEFDPLGLVAVAWAAG